MASMMMIKGSTGGAMVAVMEMESKRFWRMVGQKRVWGSPRTVFLADRLSLPMVFALFALGQTGANSTSTTSIDELNEKTEESRGV